MLHLYGTCEDTKIWAKIISAHAKNCSRMEVSVAEGRWVGQKRGSVATSRGMNAKQRDYKCGGRINTLCPIPMGITMVSREKRANLYIASGHFGAIISMKIVVEFSLLCCTSMAHAKILRYGRK